MLSCGFEANGLDERIEIIDIKAVRRPQSARRTPAQFEQLMPVAIVARQVINQIRGFLIERGITVRQGVAPLHRALPDILRLQRS